MMKYHVEKLSAETWVSVPFAEGGRTYCRGFIDGWNSLYPSPAVRVVNDIGDVIYQRGANGTPRVDVVAAYRAAKEGTQA